MSDLVSLLVGGSTALFSLAAALGAVGRRRRLTATLASQPTTPPSLYPRINHAACICAGACVDACPEGDVLGIVDGRVRLVRPSACVGHADCLRSCPMSAIELVLGTPERAVEVPVLTGSFESTVPGLYVAGELTGIGLIHNAVEQGRQAAAAALAARPPHSLDYDLIVVGAGPAGLGAALEAQRQGARCLVLEKSALGGAIKSYPRQKVVMSAPFALPGLGKVSLRRTTKEALLELFAEVIARARLCVREHAEVTRIERRPPGFSVALGDERLTAARVVLAIGRRGTPRRLGVAGEQLPHVVYGLDDPAAYTGRRVAVVGGGDTAVEAALALAGQPHTKVTLLHRGADFGRCKPDNQQALHAARDRRELEVTTAVTIHEITAQDLHLITPHGPHRLPADLVVCCLGSELPSAWLRGLGLGLRELRGEPLC